VKKQSLPHAPKVREINWARSSLGPQASRLPGSEEGY